MPLFAIQEPDKYAHAVNNISSEDIHTDGLSTVIFSDSPAIIDLSKLLDAMHSTASSGEDVGNTAPNFAQQLLIAAALCAAVERIGETAVELDGAARIAVVKHLVETADKLAQDLDA